MTTPAITDFIARWSGITGGAERANYTIFVAELCEALGLPKPGIAAGGTLGDYQYEGPVPGGALGGGTGFIDVYRRNHFILEAKQSRLPPAQAGLPLDPAADAPTTPSGAKYDQLMRDARRQAEHYAHSLPGSHAPVPFLIVCDVGRAFELYFDYAGNGRGYGFFPDKQRYRIALADLAGDAKLPGVDRTPAEVLRAIWLDPASIDPRVRAADVTRNVARKLAQVSLHLEEQGRIELRRRGEADATHEAELVEGTALFLMRILFCMFAEDVGLLPGGRFTEFLQSCVRPYDPANPGDLIDEQTLRAGLVSLWTAMDSPDPAARYAFALREQVRYFNGGLFESRAFFPLARNDLDSLIDAAKHRWTNVEPAIFGTLLEQALSAKDRAKLGAHYTPRPYVERLVQATITDVLAPEWAAAQDAIEAARTVGDDAAALAKATGFLAYLQAQRVLDPACGTGNFLYVAMETLLRLESDVIETIAALGGEAAPAIGPQNFLGLELNPRAAVIAELVLWIGWLRWRTANDPTAVPDPVLRRTRAINFGGHHGYDAVLARDEAGEIAQPPRQPDWPEAEFIVGNPPFIGKGARMHKALGEFYVKGLRAAYRAVPTSADLVMYWWERAANVLVTEGACLRRFGYVTTNLITGSLNRKLVQRHLESQAAISLVFAVPDHPWTKASKDAAAVRIAMSVAEVGGRHLGRSVRVVREANLNTDEPMIEVTTEIGRIHSNLRVGTDLTHLSKLKSNGGLSSNGMMLAGAGFKLSSSEAQTLQQLDGSDVPLRPYVSGSEIVKRPRHRFVIDFFGQLEREIRQAFPAAYTHLLVNVKDSRKGNGKSYREKRWWEFGENNPLMRASLNGLSRYIITTETTKHRVFQFIDGEVVPDHMIIGISFSDSYFLAILSSRFHEVWTRAISSPLGVATAEQGHRYNKSQIFDPFPFPDPTPEQRALIADLGEELDATRKAALAEHPRLTMTGLYNLVEKLRAGAALTAAEEVDARDARARIVRKLHDDLDAAVAATYGWPADLAPAEIVARLVALNAERAAEEKAGHVRWLRPDYQIPRFAPRDARPKDDA